MSSAESAKSHLEASGIPVYLLDTNSTAITSVASGTAKLQVPLRYSKHASQILTHLEEMQLKSTWDPSKPIEDDCRCLECGAYMSKYVDTCSQCGWSYK